MVKQAADRFIYHVVPAGELREGLDPSGYRPADLEREGFVHCAGRASVLAVADDYYATAERPVLVLEIDPLHLTAPTRWEAPVPKPGGGRAHLAGTARFPHVYGPVDREAILGVGTLSEGPEGFSWPAGFVELDDWSG